MKGLELAEQYYLHCGAPMIRKRFAGYEERIAVGLVGQGSDCYGFDDRISQDHDFGPALCLWVTGSDYEEIGICLSEAYKELPETFMGYTRSESGKAAGRKGLFRIGDFYRQFTGRADALLSWQEWLHIPEHFLAEATNGKVFRDDLGEFSAIRALLGNYYPEDIRLKKIAARALAMAQAGQYNYGRAMKRSDSVAARLALDEFIRSAISMVYLLQKRYQPFYKWAFRGMEHFTVLGEVRTVLKELVSLPVQRDAWKEDDCYAEANPLNMHDRAVELIEYVCRLVVRELRRQNLTDTNDQFLESHTEAIMSRIENDRIRALHVGVG